MSVQYSIDDPNDVHVVIEGETPAHSTRRSSGDEEAARARADAARWRQQSEANAAAAIENAKIAWTNAAAVAEAEYAAAAETGDFKKQGEAQRKVAAAEARLAILEGNQAPSHTGRVQSRSSTGDPFEDHVSQFSTPSAQWMREHRDWVTDPRKSSKLTGAHHMAVGDGYTPDTDEYFNHVEKLLNITGGNRGTGNGSGSSRSGGGETVTLTASERKMATDGTLTHSYDDPKGRWKKGDVLGVQEYGRRKLTMMKQGGWYNKIG
jgi:hypothetical protein